MGIFGRKEKADESPAEVQQLTADAPIEGDEHNPHGNEFDQEWMPWLDAMRRYDDRMLRLAIHAENWRRMAIYSLGVAVIAILVAGYAFHLPKLMPVPIAVDALGHSVLITSTEPTAALRANQEYRETVDFITHCRTVLADKMGQRHEDTACYSRLPDDSPARKFVTKARDGVNDPQVVGQNHSVEVAVTNALKISDSVWEIEWSEQSIARDGSLMGNPAKMKAHLTDKWVKSDDVKLLATNPSGYYVQELSWAPVM
ncbi:VirB8/TrbF family protein [Burkholderia sp. LMG 13014]|uniref:VirB8/TrbF family protein n=1 Tax=Burkholderia sp. LMG 13014 TaxID=2709306 RepID=UPI001962346B|nr:VirB8/TrbF family protein [Burkholderia sp. LMG 13014]